MNAKLLELLEHSPVPIINLEKSDDWEEDELFHRVLAMIAAREVAYTPDTLVMMDLNVLNEIMELARKK
jgi:hypothetical protein